MIRATQDYDVRGTLEVRDYLAMGWCWSQQKPREALRVEVLSDGKVVASGLAARLVLELVRPNITDGYHGFLLILPKTLPPGTILEAREARTGKVFGRQLPAVLPDVTAWHRRLGHLNGIVSDLHDGLGQIEQDESLWSIAWRAGGRLLDRKDAGTGSESPMRGLALRPFAEPLWTIILDLPRAANQVTEDMARWELTQLAPLLSQARAELVVIDDGRASGFLDGVKSLRCAAVPPGTGDAARLNLGLALARGAYVAIFAPAQASRPVLNQIPDTMRARAALFAAPPDGVVVGGGAAASLLSAGLSHELPVVKRATTDAGLITMPRAVYERIGAFDPVMDDGADLALLDFAFRARKERLPVSLVLVSTTAVTPTAITIQARTAFSKKYISRQSG